MSSDSLPDRSSAERVELMRDAIERGEVAWLDGSGWIYNQFGTERTSALENDWPDDFERETALWAERDRLQAENAELRGYLERFGRHERKCSIHYEEGYGCSCGWAGVEQGLSVASDENGEPT